MRCRAYSCNCIDRQALTAALWQQGRTATAEPYNEPEDAEPQLDATVLGRVEVIELYDTSLYRKHIPMSNLLKVF